MKDTSNDINQFLEGLSKEELQQLKKDLLKPDKGKPPVITLMIDIEHHHKCRLCGRIWSTIQSVKANTEDLPESVTIIYNSCFYCEYHLLTHYNKGDLAVLLVEIAERGIEMAYRPRKFKMIEEGTHRLIIQSACYRHGGFHD